MYFAVSFILCTFVPDNEPLKQAGGLASGVLWLAKRAKHDYIDKQIKAECGIENRLLFVTQIFLNPPNCLYLQKVCDFIQKYEISFLRHFLDVVWFAFILMAIVILQNWWAAWLRDRNGRPAAIHPPVTPSYYTPLSI